MASTQKVMPQKDPGAFLDYTVDLTAELGGDGLDTISWDVPAGLTLEIQTQTQKAATVWLSGGVDGEVYRITVHYLTTSGRNDSRSFLLPVRTR